MFARDGLLIPMVLVGGMLLPFFMEVHADGEDLEREARCRARQHRCELRCDNNTKGGSLAQIRCRERCHEKGLDCHAGIESGEFFGEELDPAY